MKKVVFIACIFLCYSTNAQRIVNYDESKIPEFTLPVALEMENGNKISSISEWEEKRRPEILNLFEEKVYGKIPGALNMTSYKVAESDDHAMDDTAIRKQVVLKFSKRNWISE